MANEPGYEVVWPLGRSTSGAVQLNTRLPNPDGKRIGFIWDYVSRGDDMYAIIAAELRQRYPRLEFVDHTYFGNIHGHDEREVFAALPDRLRAARVDAVIVGVGG
jgi:hypothetical protein